LFRQNLITNYFLLLQKQLFINQSSVMKHLKLKYAVLTIVFILSLFSLKAQIITTVAGNGTQGYSGDGGSSIAAELNDPWGMVFDSNGNLYFADLGNDAIRKVTTNGIISSVAINGSRDSDIISFLRYPNRMLIDTAGNLYVSEGNNSIVIKVDKKGIISVVAGIGLGGYSGDGGSASSAQLMSPMGLAFDVSGNLYIADNGNNVIRKVNKNGIISTVVGNGLKGYNGDGGLATAAELNYPSGLAIDKNGNLCIVDQNNNVIRKVGSDGIISTVAGNGYGAGKYIGGHSGDGGNATSAELNEPSGIAVDVSGNLFIAEVGNEDIRKVNTNGIISTVAGNGTQGFSGDGGNATSAELNYPGDVSVDTSGNLFIADGLNNRVRKVSFKDNITIISLTVIDTFNNQNLTRWQTTVENNVLRYNIQISSDSLNYTSIGSVKGFGSSYNYSFYDVSHNHPVNTSYYRLEVVFKDGTIVYYYPTKNLPITLFSFTAIANNEIIQTNWHTSTELNTSHFTIQHSTDGSSFTDIGTVKAIGSGANSYTYTDNNPTNGINYYRLQSVDKDGAASYSKVVSASLAINDSRLTIYPNPAKSSVTIRGNHIASVQVIDNMGRVVKVFSLKDATNPLLSVSGLAAGVYHLRIQTTDGNVSGNQLIIYN